MLRIQFFIDRYLLEKEIEVDAICDGDNILIPGIMEHLDRAGIHSGDSSTIYPPQTLSQEIKDKVLDYSRKLALELNVRGMINIQFIEFKGELYVIEVNPRASRTVPYISKVSGVPIVDIATKVMMGQKLIDLEYGVDVYKEPELISVKVPVFSTNKLSKVEVSLGPEMKSTGEVLGVGYTVEEALYKGFVAAGVYDEKKILATISNNNKEEFVEIAVNLEKLGYTFLATEGTAKVLKQRGVDVEIVRKIKEGTPNILDVIESGEIDIVVNTPTKGNDPTKDGMTVRMLTLEQNVQVIT